MQRSPDRVAALTSQYEQVRTLTDTLVEPLSAEDQLVQSMADVSPTKWHRAHTTWFFETFVLGAYQPDYVVVDPAYSYLFNSYYEAVGPRQPRAERGMLSRPSVDEISGYRGAVDASMIAFLKELEEDDPELLDLIELGLHHEQQHQELLLMDIKHVLWTHPLHPSYSDDLVAAPSAGPAQSAKPLSWTAFEAGLIDIGHDGDGFSFDNELPRHQTFVAPFEIANRLVTCGEWLAFINDGGYERADLWLSEGWQTVQTNQWDAPLYWFENDDEWQVFTLSGPRALRLDEPVAHVSLFEADAYARWADARLATEAEWEHAANHVLVEGNFADSGVLHPVPETGSGLQQLFGDVWEWTSSSYSPYPGFATAPGAVGEYNGKFMINQAVSARRSCGHTPGHTRSTYRNFFPASARWQFGGVRLARGSVNMTSADWRSHGRRPPARRLGSDRRCATT